MKKFSTLLLLLLVTLVGGVNSAWAQDYSFKRLSAFEGTSAAITDLSEITDGGTYILYCNGDRNRYLRVDPSTKKLILSSSIDVSDKTSGLAVFSIHKSQTTDDKTVYTFESAIAGSYIPQITVNGEPTIVATDSPVSYEIEAVGDGKFYIFNENGGAKIYFNGKPAVFTGWSSTGGNSQYSIIPATVSDEMVNNYQATIAIKEGSSVVSTQTQQVWEGDEITAPVASYYYTLTLDDDTKVVSADKKTFTYTATLNGDTPLEFGPWYTMKTRDDEAHYVLGTSTTSGFVAQANGSFNTSTQTTYDEFNGALWRLEKNGVGVKIYNKRAGKYLKAVAGDEATLDATGTVFYINTASLNGAVSLWIGNANQYLGNHFDWNADLQANTRLTLWTDEKSQNDGGSAFTFAKADVTEAILTVGKSALAATVDALTPNEASETMVTSGTADVIAAAKADIASDATVAAMDETLDFAQHGVLVDPTAYYQIKNVNNITNPYVSSENIFVGKDGSLTTSYKANNNLDRYVTRTKASDKLVPQIWQFVASTGHTYRVKNANTGCRMSSYTSSIDMPIDVNAGGDYTFRARETAYSGYDKTTMLQMILDGHTMNAFGGGYDKYVKAYDNHPDDPGNYWQLVKVTEVPVTISTAGWASIALPFETTVPAESGVTAYTAQRINGDKMILEEITDGVIPANEGVILAKEGGTSVNLAITSTGKAAIDGNHLQPATAKRIGFDADATYVLARDGDNVAFLQSELTSVPANKAWLPATEVTSLASVLSFVPGTTDGIGNATIDADTENETYYDLNGRVVLYPRSGVFVTKTGKKVFIK